MFTLAGVLGVFFQSSVIRAGIGRKAFEAFLPMKLLALQAAL